ncbi:secreted RxLR effector protein 161-like [Nicotiana tabacum]|uniref:Secreted RxLR effector protein 161-like n=1 Tax=Nicotiana tabacum TaxID=4097 RepID=A0AC58STE3_TOBAC
MTRPDISFSVQTLSQFRQRPKKSHMEAALRVVKYIKNSLGQGILLLSKLNNTISAYCDADWAACPFLRKSISGYLVKFGDSLISWKSKKQTTVSRSSTEAEYRSLATIVAELIWLIGLLEEVEVEVKLPVEVFSDSKVAIQIATILFITKEQSTSRLTVISSKKKLYKDLSKQHTYLPGATSRYANQRSQQGTA